MTSDRTPGRISPQPRGRSLPALGSDYWETYFGERPPDAPRRLTADELKRLARNGFPEVALRLAAGTCPSCGLSRTGAMHKDVCLRKEALRNPKKARVPARQPWEPRKRAA